MKMLQRYLIYSLFVLSCCTVKAQTEADTVSSLPGIEIVTSVNRSEAYIGDLIQYKIEIIYDAEYELIPSAIGANLGAFDVKDYKQDVSSNTPDGRKKNESSFTLSTFTIGDYIIPPVPIGFILPDSSLKVIFSELVPIRIQSLLSDSDSLDIKEIKGQITDEDILFPDRKPKYIWYLGGFIVLLITGFIIWWFFFRKKAFSVPDIHPWETAFEKMALLRQEQLPEKNAFKKYYLNLTEIVREYLGKMYMVNALDLTTEEFLEIFKDKYLPGDLFKSFQPFFDHADLVKFAKFVPDMERTKTDYNYAYEVIEMIRLDFEKQKQLEQNNKTEPEKVTAGGIDG